MVYTFILINVGFNGVDVFCLFVFYIFLFIYFFFLVCLLLFFLIKWGLIGVDIVKVTKYHGWCRVTAI